MGFVGQSPLDQDDPIDWIQFTPGVSLTARSDSKGQQYSSPADAVRKGADIIIVGRGFIQHAGSIEALSTAAEQYRLEGWNSFVQRSHRV